MKLRKALRHLKKRQKAYDALVLRDSRVARYATRPGSMNGRKN